MKFLTLTALLATANACNSGDADCYCDADDANCLELGADCSGVPDHPNCENDLIAAPAVVGACADGEADDCECDGDSCLEVGTPCNDGDHASCLADDDGVFTITATVADDDVVVGEECTDCEAANCECPEGEEVGVYIEVEEETGPAVGEACDPDEDGENCVCLCDGEACDDEDDDEDRECTM